MDKRKERRDLRRAGALERRRKDALLWARRATEHRENGDMEGVAFCERKARLAKLDIQRLEAKLG